MLLCVARERGAGGGSTTVRIPTAAAVINTNTYGHVGCRSMGVLCVCVAGISSAPSTTTTAAERGREGGY